MESVFKAAVQELDDKNPMVVATVVRTSGSTPQKSGAKLLVREDGSGVGTLGGGCVEGDIWFAAQELLKRGGDAELRDYQLNEDLAAQDGLVCGGTMYFLIDPVRESDPYKDFAAQAVAAYAGGSPMAIVNVTAAPSKSNVVVGAKMLVRENGDTQGSLGDEILEAMTVDKARDLMAMGKNDYLYLDSGIECYIEAYTTPPTLVLIGGGHVSKAIAPIAKSVGFRIFVFDDREQFANPERFPEADITLVGDYRDGFDKLPVNANSFVVVASRGHQFDDAAVSGALKTPASYIGLLGSKRKTILIYEELIRNGFDPEELRRINAPIGLDIGGRTPEEIALSVMSEIVAFRLGGNGGSMKLQERLLDKAIERANKSQSGAQAVAAG
ncbi:MAG: hypothetical protein F4Y63_09045 [Chloroflexi bacterium]|nr:hypothetical protein [Chloroflexota bacterium]MYK61546.1 hypothetical protein [Chloroflexota bacterium]